MAASMQSSLFGTDSKSSNSDSNPLDSIALEEFVGAAVKKEDNLSERFITLRLYKEEDDVSYLDPNYPQLEDEMEQTEDTSPNIISNTTSISVKTKSEDETAVPDVTSSSVICNLSGDIIKVAVWNDGGVVFEGKTFKNNKGTQKTTRP